MHTLNLSDKKMRNINVTLNAYFCIIRVRARECSEPLERKLRTMQSGMRPTNCANNSGEVGIAYVNGYSDPPPTIIETAFSVPINVSLSYLFQPFSILRRPFHTRSPSSSDLCTIAPLFSSFPLRVLTANLWFGNSPTTRWVDDRAPEIYGLPEAGASYKLNLRNYGSNYVRIRAITGASTAPAYLGRFTLMSPFVMRMKAIMPLSSTSTMLQ